MYALIGEDKSDVETIKELIHRIEGHYSTKIKTHGYSGCGELIRKGATKLRAFHSLGCERFVICYDSDRDCPIARKKTIVEKIINPSGVKGYFCALVPIQEIESWILADITAVSKVIPSWKPTKEFHNPETENDPKEILENLSKQFQRPRYVHAIHNSKVAKHLDISLLFKKCESFRPLIDFVQNSKSNV